MPIVCVTEAAGLGVLGVVITPCALLVEMSAVKSTAHKKVDSFSIYMF
jgi:hypothetical protein